MQFDLNGALGGAAAFRGLKDAGEHVVHTRTGLLFQMWAMSSFLRNMTGAQWPGFDACASEGM